jgi:hypothetical protein
MSSSEDKSLNERDDADRNRSPSESSIEMQTFEARLAQLSPRSDRLDRERLIFLAGQASVSNTDFDGAPRARDWRYHPGWPAAFATMSAVAATLLLMLIMRPAVTNGLPIVSNDSTSTDRRVASPLRTGQRTPDESSFTLSVRDGIQGDTETLLRGPSEVRSVVPEAIYHDPLPPLTPSAWQRVSGDAQPHARPAGSSSLPSIRGINS